GRGIGRQSPTACSVVTDRHRCRLPGRPHPQSWVRTEAGRSRPGAQGYDAVAMLEQGRIAVHDLGSVRVVALVGEHDLSTVDVLSDEVDRQFREVSHLVVDLS